MIRPIITTSQAEALAAYIVTLRPGQRSWTKQATIDALKAATDKFSNDPEVLTRAAVRAALDPIVKTPQVIGMSGRHWDATGVDVDPRSGEGAKAVRCKCGDVHTRTAPCRTGAPTRNHTTHVEQMRANLKAQREEKANG